jgi:hypothetical protein
MITRVRQFLGACDCCQRAMTILRRHPAVGLAALALFGAWSASAFAGNQVRLKLEGSILPECSIGSGSGGTSAALGLPLELDDITKPGRKDYAFLVNCNAPFSYRLEAQYGALTNTGPKTTPDGFTAAIPYEVAVRIPTDGAPIQDSCPGESLRSGRVSCPFSNSGNSIAMLSQAQLSLTWRPPDKMPMAGKYVDRLTIMIAANI